MVNFGVHHLPPAYLDLVRPLSPCRNPLPLVDSSLGRDRDVSEAARGLLAQAVSLPRTADFREAG